MRRISINRTAIIVRYDRIPAPADMPAVERRAGRTFRIGESFEALIDAALAPGAIGEMASSRAARDPKWERMQREREPVFGDRTGGGR